MDSNNVTKSTMENSVNKKPSATTGEETNSNVWRYVSIGGTMGIVMLANASPATMENVMAALNDSFSPDAPASDELPVDDAAEPDVAAVSADVLPDAPASDELPVDDVAEPDVAAAPAADDSSVSFAEAFAAARSEFGAGGVFEWRGNLYNTYYQEEWESMSNDERNSFCDNAMANRDYLSSDDVAVDVTADLLDEEYTNNMLNIEDAVEEDSELEDIDDDADFADISVDDADINELSSDEVAVLDDDSDVYVIGANDENAAPGWSSEIYSEGISVIDTDGDGVYDVAIVADDLDGDGVLSSNEVCALADIDADGVYDIVTLDYNNDGEFSFDETFDISDAGIAFENGEIIAPGLDSSFDDFSFEDNNLVADM